MVLKKKQKQNGKKEKIAWPRESNMDHLNVKSPPRLLCQVAILILIIIRQGKLLYLKHLLMKFCQYMLSEAGGAVFIKDSKIYSKKLRRILMVKVLL